MEHVSVIQGFRPGPRRGRMGWYQLRSPNQSEIQSAEMRCTGVPLLLREHRSPLSYEDEGSDRVARGSVTLASGTWWFSELVVPMKAGQPALLTISRHGSGAGLEPREAALVIPPAEAEAFLVLLQGLIAQARSDGVLRDSSPAEL